jgi:hypothetical protein
MRRYIRSFLPPEAGKLEEKKLLKQFLLTFLGPASECGINSRKVAKKIFHCTFLLIEKYQKIKTANKFLKLFSIPLKKNNSSRLIFSNSGTQTDFSFVASFQIIFSPRQKAGRRNLFEVVLTEKFLNLPCRQAGAILLRCGRGVVN